MNLILFDEPFTQICLSSSDPRAQHLYKTLRVCVGSKVFVGFVNGLRARAVVSAVENDGSVSLNVIATELAPRPLPIRLLIGLPRPHIAKRILFEAASMGVQDLHFFQAMYSEPSYAQSSLWTKDEWKKRVRLGTEQSFGTYVPNVAMHTDLKSAFGFLEGQGVRIALDNYEGVEPLTKTLRQVAFSAVVALGPERGWSASERDIFRTNGWKIAHLGPQVLRIESACTAAVAIISANLGFYDDQTRTAL